ncbi:MAG: OmpA family protein [Deltaproteobacteria bacterium]|nr:OmpA family protein [Deltaproteobacteria bacterium]
MRAGVGRRRLFPVNVWPPFVDAVTLVLAAVVLLMLVAVLAQHRLLARLRTADDELTRLRDEKARIERRLRALAPSSVVDIEGGKVILQGEVLFASGSDALTAEGERLIGTMGEALAKLLKAEPNQMALVGGHTDNKSLRPGRFANNWELSAARAVAVSRVLMTAGVPADKVVAAGFGEHHPRASNDTEEARRRNRRIEVLLVPITTVASR